MPSGMAHFPRKAGCVPQAVDLSQNPFNQTKEIGNEIRKLQTLFGAGVQHGVVYRVLYDLDDAGGNRRTDSETARADGGAVRHPYRHPRAFRLAGACAAGDSHRQIRRPHRAVCADAGKRAVYFSDAVCHRILAVSRHRFGDGFGGRLVFGGHALCRPLVFQRAAGFGDGRVRRGQCRQCG